MNEARAIRLCLDSRDPAGFDWLVRQYRCEAYMHAFGILGNREDAEDACQDSFSRAFAAMPRLDSLDRFYPWFYRILRNRCLNMIGRRQTATKHADSVRYEAESSEIAGTPLDVAEAGEDRAQVWQALQELPVNHREILVLKYFQHRSYAEMSELLEIPRGTVMSRLYNARTAFRKTYETLSNDE